MNTSAFLPLEYHQKLMFSGFWIFASLDVNSSNSWHLSLKAIQRWCSAVYCISAGAPTLHFSQPSLLLLCPTCHCHCVHSATFSLVFGLSFLLKAGVNKAYNLCTRLHARVKQNAWQNGYSLLLKGQMPSVGSKRGKPYTSYNWLGPQFTVYLWDMHNILYCVILYAYIPQIPLQYTVLNCRKGNIGIPSLNTPTMRP